MSPARDRAFSAVVMLLGALLAVAVTTGHAQYSCPTGFANFGDSLTDTGNAVDAFPFYTDAENSPYGDTFFGKPAKRFSNGRLVPDFFSQAFRVPLLDAYFSINSFDYKFGINFAEAGATAAFSPKAVSPFPVTPFQTNQFIRFKNNGAVAESQSFGVGCFNFNNHLPQRTRFDEDPLSTWLYTITVGGNDLLPPLEQGVSVDVVNGILVANAVKGVTTAITTLYATGARQFLIFGAPAGGCSTIVLTLMTVGLPTDGLGCIISVNNVVQNYNSQLLAEIKLLRTSLTGSNIAYFDYYAANVEILTNPATYGFNPALTKTACCGAPGVGNLNYNPNFTCGHPDLGSTNCPDPDQHVNWDGIHFTENFYRTISNFALNGLFMDGGVNYTALCNLDFTKFGSDVSFHQAYPLHTCNNLFT